MHQNQDEENIRAHDLDVMKGGHSRSRLFALSGTHGVLEAPQCLSHSLDFDEIHGTEIVRR